MCTDLFLADLGLICAQRFSLDLKSALTGDLKQVQALVEIKSCRPVEIQSS